MTWILKYKCWIFLGLAILFAGLWIYSLSKRNNITPTTNNSVVNNCDTIYQVINYNQPINLPSFKTKSFSRNHGIGLSVGYQYSLMQSKGSIFYEIGYRRNNFIFSGSYLPEFQAGGVKVGYQFDNPD